MKLQYRIYDQSRHCYLTDLEARVAPSGQVWINMASHPFEDWRELADTAEDIVIEQVMTTEERNHLNAE